MNNNGISKLNLKKINRSEILKIIIKNGPTSRIEIANKINLTRAAITIITNEMIQEGIIYEKGEERVNEKNGRGRRKILLDINENYKFCFGIVFDNQKVFIGLSNLKGETLDKSSLNIESKTIEELIEEIYSCFHEMLRNSSLQISNIIGIGVCVSNDCFYLLNGKDKKSSMQLLKKMLERRMNISVVINNTIEGLAIAEMTFNKNYKEKTSNMVFIRYGYEIDAVMILQDKIYHRPSHDSNWFSHIVVDTKGDYCECGKKGCCRTKMSIDIIKQKVLDLYKEGKTPILYEKTNGDIGKIDFTIENLKVLLSDISVKHLYEEALEYLTYALDNLITVIAPEKIVLFDFVFEKILDLESLITIMKREHNISFKDKIKLSTISMNNIYLAGNGICVDRLFVEVGGE